MKWVYDDLLRLSSMLWLVMIVLWLVVLFSVMVYRCHKNRGANGHIIDAECEVPPNPHVEEVYSRKAWEEANLFEGLTQDEYEKIVKAVADKGVPSVDRVECFEQRKEMTMYLYHRLVGFTREDMEAEIKAMTREAMQLEARAAGLYDGVEQLKYALIEDVLKEKEIMEGDKCVMHFADVDLTVEFVEAKDGGIYIRHFGSKGKPYKHPKYYDYTYAELLEKSNTALESAGGLKK